MKERRPHRHPLVFVAFILALVVFIMPTHADLMFSAIMTRRPVTMAIVTLTCFGTVLLPLIAGLLLARRNPDRWRKSKLAATTWVILGLAFLFNCFGWYTLINKKAPANHASQPIAAGAAQAEH